MTSSMHEIQQATTQLLGIAIANLSKDAALALLYAALADDSKTSCLKVAFCNAHTANIAATHEVFRRHLARFLVLPDGIGVDLGRRLLKGAPFKANLNGTDFTPLLFEQAPTSLRVVLLGAEPQMAERAAHQWSKTFPRHHFWVLSDGFFSPDEEPALLAQLAAHKADILLVAMGNPRQEIWLAEKIGNDHAHVAIGVGALFDFTAGKVERAPGALRQLRLEWLFRLMQEPRRLWRRYVLGNPLFLARVLRQKLNQMRSFPSKSR